MGCSENSTFRQGVFRESYPRAVVKRLFSGGGEIALQPTVLAVRVLEAFAVEGEKDARVYVVVRGRVCRGGGRGAGAEVAGVTQTCLLEVTSNILLLIGKTFRGWLGNASSGSAGPASDDGELEDNVSCQSRLRLARVLFLRRVFETRGNSYGIDPDFCRRFRSDRAS